VNHQIAPVSGWYRVMTKAGQLGERLWLEPGQLVTLTSGQWVERDEAGPAHTLSLTTAELDAVIAGLMWASQLKRAVVDGALTKALRAQGQ